MPIRRKYAEAQVARAFTDYLDAQRRRLIRWLCYVGESALVAARQNGSYTDRTGNLRASVGYVVAWDGRREGLGGFAGVNAEGQGGRAYAMQLARRTAEGPVLIVVAGMQYASYVAARGYDVLDSAELVARDLVRQLAAGGI